MTPVEFLTARLDEREALAMASVGEHWHAQSWSELRTAAHDEAGSSEPCWYQLAVSGTDGGPHAYHGDIDDRPTFRHIAANDPSYVLADIAAKRAILELHQAEEGQHPDFCGHDLRELPCPTMRLLLQPFADHPDYDPKWAA